MLSRRVNIHACNAARWSIGPGAATSMFLCKMYWVVIRIQLYPKVCYNMFSGSLMHSGIQTFRRRVIRPQNSWLLDFVYRLVFRKLENTAFRKLHLFPSSGEGT
jgi:hypothetical protein